MLSPGMTRPYSAPLQQQSDPERCHQHEVQERPVGNRQPEEGPVDCAAVAAATEQHRDHAPQRERLDHAEQVATAGRDLGREPLQPALARGDTGTGEREQRHQAAAPARGRYGQRGTNASGQRHQDEQVALHDAHRAGLEPDRMLQIEAEGQQGDAGGGNQRQQAARLIEE